MATTFWKAVAVILVLANLKSLPFAFHVRFYYLAIKHLYILRRRKPRSVFQSTTYWTHAPSMELDFNLHKSNSTYFSDLDMARADLMMVVFKDFFTKFKDPQQPGMYWPYTPLGAVLSVFRREIFAYRPYVLKSRVLGWDNKWLFVLTRFEFPSGTLSAVSLSKYVFKMKRKTIPPAEVIEFCGLLSPEVLKKGAMGYEHAKKLLELEAIENEDVKVAIVPEPVELNGAVNGKLHHQ